MNEECNHYKEAEHGTIDAVNPFNGKCCICGEQVREASNE